MDDLMNMMRVDVIEKMDKLDAQHTMKIPSCMKHAIDTELGPIQRKALNTDILIVMAKHIHASRFKPSLYLSSESSTETV